ncbi:hypothetical protein EJ05DRAFT_321124 [Pseudovirgaria hyperparasitica]|uniref:Uncharacterized protein n=1 Tax=Pseudovirgaria hyperparasitica TaxID=470096 RepID=A0A6A6VTC3_9PEZI|nr:uncharacterized protein EJ05DRAFT_321124 [Pseudovirgaria hyperparasitica]KAF2752487.1 hypothetical protein EJ05DRAFT_321124 [Pseudovirgaria hyperparasitica]
MMSQGIPLPNENGTSDILLRLEEKAKQISSSGLTRKDQILLRSGRLQLAWGEVTSKSSVSLWRKKRARQLYNEIQSMSPSLGFVVLICVTPTECAQKSFDHVMQILSRLDHYETFRLKLDSIAKRFLESTAAEQGFTSNKLFFDFMKSMFPDADQEPRKIKFAYTNISFEKIPHFLEYIVAGILSSQAVKGEKSHGLAQTGSLTVMVPTSSLEDGSCNILVDRKTLMDAIYKFGFKELPLERT